MGQSDLPSIQVVLKEFTRSHHVDIPISRDLKEVAITADDCLYGAGYGASNELVVVGISANGFGQRIRLVDFGIDHREIYYRVNLHMGELSIELKSNTAVFVENLQRSNQCDGALVPGCQNPTRWTREEDTGLREHSYPV